MLRIDESWMAEDKRILTAAGESKSLAAAMEGKNLRLLKMRSLGTIVGEIRSLGCMPIYWGILVFMRSSLENIQIFCGELRMRVFNLLGD